MINAKNFLNFNAKVSSTFISEKNGIKNNNLKNNNKNGNKQNLFYIQKIEEEPQQLRINTVINTISPSFSVSANSSVSNKNKKYK